MGFSSSGDNNRKKFTGYERDNETGLDFAQARYYASAHGRFTSPDSVSGHVSNPQSWNRYAYVTNNPVNLTDSTGLMIDASQDWESVGAELRARDPRGPKRIASDDNSAAEAGFDWGLSDLFAGTGGAAYNGDGIVDTNAGETAADEAPSPQNSGVSDNTIAVTAASIEPFGIEGRISGVNQDVVNFSAPSSSGIFAEGARFDITMTLRLPKNTTELEETLPEEVSTQKGDRPGGQRNVVVHGSSVDNGGTNNNFQFATRYENGIMGKGKVSFSGVDYRAGIATARFSLSTKIYDPSRLEHRFCKFGR